MAANGVWHRMRLTQLAAATPADPKTDRPAYVPVARGNRSYRSRLIRPLPRR